MSDSGNPPKTEAQAAWDRVNGEVSADHLAAKSSGLSPRLMEEIYTQGGEEEEEGEHAGRCSMACS